MDLCFGGGGGYVLRTSHPSDDNGKEVCICHCYVLEKSLHFDIYCCGPCVKPTTQRPVMHFQGFKLLVLYLKELYAMTRTNVSQLATVAFSTSSKYF